MGQVTSERTGARQRVKSLRHIPYTYCLLRPLQAQLSVRGILLLYSMM